MEAVVAVAVVLVAVAGVPSCLTRDSAADMIYHGVLVCVLMSLNHCVGIIDQSPPPPLSSLYISPVSYSSPCIVFLPPSPAALCFICISVLSFPSLHLCLFYIHLSIEPSLLPSFSLTEREIININVSVLLLLPPLSLFIFPPSLFFVFLLLLISSSHYLYLSLGLYPSSSLSLNLPSICLHSLSLSFPATGSLQLFSIHLLL